MRKKTKVIFLGNPRKFTESFLEGLRVSMKNNNNFHIKKSEIIFEFKPLPAKRGRLRFIQKNFFSRKNKPILLYPGKPDFLLSRYLQDHPFLRNNFFSLGPPLSNTLGRNVYFFKNNIQQSFFLAIQAM